MSSKDSSRATDKPNEAGVNLSDEQLALGEMKRRSREANDAAHAEIQVRQWRCHPRLYDAIDSITRITDSGVSEIGHRFGLLYACMKSKPGYEPRAEDHPFATDPEAHRPRWKSGELVRNAKVGWEAAEAKPGSKSSPRETKNGGRS